MTESSVEFYKSIVKTAKKYQSEHSDDEWQGGIAVLEAIIKTPFSELSRVSLGVFEVPVNKIKGTLAAGRAFAFAGNFLPVLPDNSEFAGKWISLYESQMSVGIREPGTAYEYLGYYYVIEGHKRVSVLKSGGAVSVPLDVTRLLPPENDGSSEAEIYREVLKLAENSKVVKIWFSKSRNAKNLKKIIDRENENSHNWEEIYDLFRGIYKKLYSCNITTGDAFLSFVATYGFPKNKTADDISQALKLMERQFQSDAKDTKNTKIQLKLKKNRRILFVYSGNDYWNALHRYGQKVVGQNFPEFETEALYDFDKLDNPSATLLEYAEKGGIIFVTDPKSAQKSLKVQLAQKESLIFQCAPEKLLPIEPINPTYYGKTEEPLAVLGALAASVSVTKVIGVVIAPSKFRNMGVNLESIQAFALAAHVIDPKVSVLTDTIGAEGGLGNSPAKLAELKCDYVLISQIEERFAGHGFPSVFAQLVRLNKLGYIDEYVASAYWDFGKLYTKICKELFFEEQGYGLARAGIEPISIMGGLSDNVLNISANKVSLSVYGVELLRIAKKVVIDGGVKQSNLSENDLETLITPINC